MIVMQKRTLKDLINTEDPAWPSIQSWMKAARNNVEILPPNRGQGEDILLYLQITTRSPLGAIALETGGLLIDNGWLRFLGSGHQRLLENLLSWNAQEIFEGHAIKDLCIIAHDVMGGFFALNGGAFAGKLGTVFYFAPDTLRWESTNKSYSSLLEWALSGDIDLFYKNIRWPGWQNDIAVLSGGQGLSIYPFLFVQKEIPISQRSRRPIPMEELWHLYLNLAQKLRDLPAGTPVQFIIEEEFQEKKDLE